MLLSCFVFVFYSSAFMDTHTSLMFLARQLNHIAVSCWEITICQESAVPIFEFNGLDIENNQPSELWISWRNFSKSPLMLLDFFDLKKWLQHQRKLTCRQTFELAAVDAKPTLLTYSFGNLYLPIYCQANISCIFCSVILYIYSHTSVELLLCDLFLFSNKWALKRED